MVRSEVTQKIKHMAREGVLSGSNELSDRGDIRTKEAIDKVEKDIARLVMIAEKDKREAIIYGKKIKILTEQLQAFFNHRESFSEDMRRCYSEGNLMLHAEVLGYSITPPSLSYIPTSKLSTSACSKDLENKSPNISPPNVSPHSGAPQTKEQEDSLEAILDAKNDELARVKHRAQQEAQRTSSLRAKEEELRSQLDNEIDQRRKTNNDIRLGIERKEKEIQRLSMLAERDKRNSMHMRDQLLAQKKTLAAFILARADKRHQLEKIITSCDELITSPKMAPRSPPALPSSLPNLPPPLQLTPVSPSPLSLLVRESSGNSTPFNEELNKLVRADANKGEELSRVRAIADMETQHAMSLRDKSEEIKSVITSELQAANEEIEIKLNQIRRRQEAIQKVAARAEIEHNKACKIQAELDQLGKLLSEVRSGVEIRKSEYIPDKAYFSEFTELRDLVPVDVSSTSGSPNSTTSDKDGATTDPLTFLRSPQSKQVSILGSEAVYVQKLQDLKTLDEEILRKDDELKKIKRLKEEELLRKKLLMEKAQEVKEEIEYVLALKRTGCVVSRTY